MQFEMCHGTALANLWAAPFVAGSVFWAALLADQAWRARALRSVRWTWVLVLALGTPVGARLAASFIDGPDGCSIGYIGSGVWMALPLSLPFLLARFLVPKASGLWLSARVVALLTCLHAWWTLTLFPRELLQWTAQVPRELPAIIAPAPFVATMGVAGLLLIQMTVGSGAGTDTWRAWMSDRLQFCAASLASLYEMQIAPLAIFPQGDSGEPVFSFPFIIALTGIVFSGQAWLRAAALRQQAARSVS